MYSSVLNECEWIDRLFQEPLNIYLQERTISTYGSFQLTSNECTHLLISFRRNHRRSSVACTLGSVDATLVWLRSSGNNLTNTPCQAPSIPHMQPWWIHIQRQTLNMAWTIISYQKKDPNADTSFVDVAVILVAPSSL